MITLRQPLTALSLVACLALSGCGITSQSGPGTPSSAPTQSSMTSQSATPTPTVTPTATPMTSSLTIYYIAVGDAGRSGVAAGCGDSAVATYTSPVRQTDPVGSAIQTLLANHHRYVGQSGLLNALYQSTLAYRGHRMSGPTVLLYLTGTFRIGGVCDIPRVKAQLEYTAMKAAHASRAVVYVGTQTIDQALSLK